MAPAPVIVLDPSVTPYKTGLQLEYGSGYAHGWSLWAISGCCDAHIQWDMQNPPKPYCSVCAAEPRDYIPPQASYFRLKFANPTALNAWAANWTGLNGIRVDVCIPGT